MQEAPRFRPTRESFQTGSLTLPQEYFVSEDIFREEQDKIFKGWQCVGHVSQLRNNGDYLTFTEGNESLIVLRREAGEIRSFFNVCRHRGSRICMDESGKFEGTIQCPYHKWTYELDGRLRVAPNKQGDPGFDKGNYPLSPAQLHLWEGFIFADLDSKHFKPFSQAYPEMPKLDAWSMGTLSEYKRISYSVKANWKHVIQNFNECDHCSGVHPELTAICDIRSGSNDFTDGPVLGGFLNLKEGVESLTTSGEMCAPVLGDLDSDQLRRGYYYSLGNLLLFNHPDYVMYALVIPQSVGETLVDCRWLFAPDATNGTFKPEEAVAFWDEVNKQDWEACRWSQLGVASQAYTPGPYSAQESLLTAFDRNYLNVMGRIEK